MLNFTTDQFHYQADSKTFVEESSMLELPRQMWNSLIKVPAESSISLKNPATGLTKVFYFYMFDTTPSGEVAGWNYSSGDLRLLIIND